MTYSHTIIQTGHKDETDTDSLQHGLRHASHVVQNNQLTNVSTQRNHDDNKPD